MIILRQREFGNKANKAAKRLHEYKLGGGIDIKKEKFPSIAQSRIAQGRRRQNPNPIFERSTGDINEIITVKGKLLRDAENNSGIFSLDNMSELNKKQRVNVAKNINKSEIGNRFARFGKTSRLRDIGSKVYDKYSKKALDK